MSGSYILDTNIVIALFGNDALVAKEIATADEIYLPAIVAGVSRRSKRTKESQSMKMIFG